MISNETSTATGTLSGATGTIVVGFYFFANTDLVVTRTRAGVITTLTLDSDYSVVGAGNESGGSITVTGQASGDVITIVRTVPLTQLVDLVPLTKLSETSLEQALDKLTMIGQQLKRSIDASGFLPTRTPLTALGVDGDGNWIQRSADDSFSFLKTYGGFFGTSSGTVAEGNDSRIIAGGTALQPTGNGAQLTGLTRSQVGLGNVDNTSDANKPVSTAQAAAIALKQDASSALALGETSGTAYRGDRGKTAYDHSQITSGNPHGTTAAQVGAATAAQGALADTAVQPASTGVSGQVTFYNGAKVISGENVFTWDSTNNRLGVGTNTPLSAFHVVGNGVTATDPSSYTPTVQGRSQTVSVEGSNCAYFFAKAGSSEAAYGISTNGNVFIGGISNTTVEVRVNNLDVFHYTSSGPNLVLGTASRVVVTDSNKNVVSSSVTVSELNRLIGISSDIATTAYATNAVNAAVSGTVNKLAKFSGTHSVGDSTITDTTSKISIVGTAPASSSVGAELIAQDTFTLGSGWSGTFASGFTHTPGSTATLSGSTTFSVGTIYKIAWTITNRTAGSITVSAAGISTSSITATGNTQTSATATTAVVITPTSDFNGTVVLSITQLYPYAASFELSSSNAYGGINAPLEIRLSSKIGNIFIGDNSGQYNSDGLYLLGIGDGALSSNTTGSYNSAVGKDALRHCTTGGYNMAFGFNAGGAVTTGAYNTFFGSQAGANVVTGSRNICIGTAAGYSNEGSSCVFIGSSAGNYQTAQSSLVIIDGYGNRGSAANELDNSLIVGRLGSVASSQKLSLNAVVTTYSHLCQTTLVPSSVTLATTSTRNQIVTAAGVTVTLPAAPTTGLEYIIVTRGNAPTVAGNGKSIYYQSASAVSSVSVSSTAVLVHLIFDGTYWVIA